MQERKTLDDREKMTELERIRHSCAHVMATAMLRLWPEAQFASGPPVENGFYYDVELSHRISPEDFEKIEAEMKKEIKANHPFKKIVVSREQAMKDAQSGRVGALGERPMPSKFKIGQELGLFVIDTEYVGPGLPLWLPNGAAIVEELEKLAKETEFAAGYVRVKTPHIAKEKMYLTSGHLPVLYKESMFPPMELEEDVESLKHEPLNRVAAQSDSTIQRFSDSTKYYLKAMNCPHHHRIFAAQPRSYRDLPLRLAEYGTNYRYEQSGELFGLMRVRCLNMNDAHIYCAPEEFAAEFNAVNEMYLKYFKIFGIEKYVMRFSTHDPARLSGDNAKFVNEPALWKQTEDMVRDTLKNSGIPYVEVPNEAAFYGPKIDVQVWSVIGREFTLATNQVDFAVPKSFGLAYKDRDNTEKTPLCIHRAPLGTHERFIGFLIEHYAGNFPLWLAPEQVRVITLGTEEPLLNYAKDVVSQLRANMVRAEGDYSNDKINGKIQQAEVAKVHTMLVVGPRDMAANAVSVRLHGKGSLGAKPRSEVIQQILTSVRERSS